MNIEKTPAPPGAPVVRPELATWFERAGGPPVVVFQVHSQQGLAHEIDWHRHLRGQLISVESGLLTTRTERGEWSLPPGCAGWMPPDALHTVEITGPLRGWGLLVEPAACATLPARPCVLGIGELVRALALRLAEWPPAELLQARPLRLAGVLLDELGQAPTQALHLPMPHDRRLLRIAARLLAEPADAHGLEHWAHWAGLSPRSLSRHFRAETGLGFAQWRQQARLAESLRLLYSGVAVGDIAHRLGYSSASAFVTVFRQHYGTPPARYLQRIRPPLAAADGLASPAASG